MYNLFSYISLSHFIPFTGLSGLVSHPLITLHRITGRIESHTATCQVIPHIIIPKSTLEAFACCYINITQKSVSSDSTVLILTLGIQ